MPAASDAATAAPAAAPTAAAISAAAFQTQIDALNAELDAALATRRILSTADAATITAALNRYTTLNQQLQQLITNASRNTDTGAITTNIGALQQEIKNLQEEHAQVKQEADTAAARKRSVETVEQNVSYHQLYLIDRPLRQLSIPTLFTLSVAFLLGGIHFLYKINAPTVTESSFNKRVAQAMQPITGLFGSSAPAAAAPAAPTGFFGDIFKVGTTGPGLSTYFK